ncbi:MAG: hypothetical protein ACSHX9_17220 [Luteolibacter sp.]
MNKKILSVFVISSMASQADVLTSAQRFFGLGGQVPEYSEETGELNPTVIDQVPYSPADSDLGVQEILVPRSDKQPIIFDFSTAIYRTDEAASGNPLSNGSSWVSATSLALSWRPHMHKGWYADVGMGLDVLRFDRTSAVDFENLNLRAGVFKLLPDLDNTILFARLELQRITSGSYGNADYNAQRIRAGLQKILWSAPRHQLSSSLSSSYEWTSRPLTVQRNDISLEAVYQYSITNNLFTRVSAKASRFDYEQLSRKDWTYAFGLELIWQMTENFSANASLFFDKNDSNTPAFISFDEYETWTTGLGVSAQLTF